MPPKIDPDYVEQYITKAGYTLLDRYTKAITPMTMNCNKGHENVNISWNNFQRGTRCKFCAREIIGQKLRLSHAYVEKYITEAGYTLLDKYEGSSIPMLMNCNKGHKNVKISWDNFIQGYRCKYCGRETTAEKLKLSFEYVKKYIESYNYILLSTEYINNNSHLKVKCPYNDHEPYEITFNNFYKGSRCKKCFLNNNRLPYDFIKKYIENYNYILLSEIYINSYSYIRIKCPDSNHEPYDTTFNNFEQGSRCKACFLDSIRLTYQYVKNYIERYNYILLSETYKNSYSCIKIKCPNSNHESYKTKFCHFHNGHRCRKCHFKNRRLSFEGVKQFIEKTGNELVSTNYVDRNSILKIKCGKCKEIFERSFNNYRKYHNCSLCRPISYGEEIVYDYLKKWDLIQKDNIHIRIVNTFDF